MSLTPFGFAAEHACLLDALVVEPELPHLVAILSALSHLGFDVSLADGYADARSALSEREPALLVTGLKLREYNGLHLVLRGRSTWPRLASVVTSDVFDAMLQLEAEKLGATFVVMPTSRDELVAAMCRTILGRDRPAANVEPIRPPFERRLSDRRGCSIEGHESTLGMVERRTDIREKLRGLSRG